MRWAVILAVLLLLPGASSTWNQAGGDGGRTGQTDLPAETLDVVSSYSITRDSHFIIREPFSAIPSIVDSSRGPLFLSRAPAAGQIGTAVNAEPCRLSSISNVVTGDIAALFEFACPAGADLLGYNAQRDWVLLSVDDAASSAVLRAYSLDGELAWSTGPDVPAAADVGFQENGDWFVGAMAMSNDGATGYVVFAKDGSGVSRLQAFDVATGEPLWEANLGALARAAFDSSNDPPEEAHAWGESVPSGLAVGETGLVVSTQVWYNRARSGTAFDDDLRTEGEVGPFFFFDLNGQYQDAIDPATPLLSTERLNLITGVGTGSLSASASGGSAVFAKENVVFRVNPGTGSVTALVAEPGAFLRAAGCVSGATPIWLDDRALLFGGRSGVLLQSNDDPRLVYWQAPDAMRIHSAFTDAAGGAYMLLDAPGATNSVFMSRLNDQMHEVQRLPLPGTWQPDCRSLITVPTNTPPGILVVDPQTAHAVFIAQANPALAPEISVSDVYPAVGAAVEVAATARPGDDLHLFFGDGHHVPAAQHASDVRAYKEPGPRTVRAVAIHPDGLTSTASVILHVGEPPPQNLNWVQERFTPQNQDTTWGVVGLILVLVGAAISLATRRIGRSRISTGLRELAGIREDSAIKPIDGLRELQHWHGVQEGRLLRGRLTEDQFRVLENRGARLVRSLLRTLVHPLNLDAKFAQKLDAAVTDGFVDPMEASELRGEADRLQMVARDKRKLLQVLDAWSMAQ